ncbi:type II secretion system minor pseudopilin GspK [Pseudoduganella rhizocola]|uniref:type II secretion system minor pseudopilin GspK n=1 Tax=Pseudoduganella rhizocola TaxID=3382643 RepID=UPI0038B56DA7
MSARLAKQRGVAVVTALLLTTLAVTIVASLFWQQQVQVRSMENQRLHLQTRWILRGALDWAKLILWQDGRDNTDITAENGVWATPLAETRLDQYVERERLQNESYDATISGQVYDAQSRYNLMSLAPQGQVQPKEVEVFERLLAALQLDGGLAIAVANEVSRTTLPPKTAEGSGSKDAEPVAMMRIEDLLGIAGFTPQSVERLRDFVIVLPEPTKVNVNTAPAELLSALVPGMPVSEAQSIVLSRRRSAFNQSAFSAVLNGRPTAVEVDYKSGYFLVQSRVKLDRASLETWALIKRTTKPILATTVEWIREI